MVATRRLAGWPVEAGRQMADATAANREADGVYKGTLAEPEDNGVAGVMRQVGNSHNQIHC